MQVWALNQYNDRQTFSFAKCLLTKSSVLYKYVVVKYLFWPFSLTYGEYLEVP